MFTGKEPAGGNVLLTPVQGHAGHRVPGLGTNKLKVKTGAIVAMDPNTGAILAEVSMPSYDPAQLSTHDTAAATAAYKKLDADPNKPLLNRAVSEIYPPGSTFKIIVSSAAMTADSSLTPDSIVPGGEVYKPPQVSDFQIKNSHTGVCPDQITVRQALTVSCNTVFARMGVERVGADKLKAMAQAFGFEQESRLVEDQENNYCGIVASHTGSMTTARTTASTAGRRSVEHRTARGEDVSAARRHDCGDGCQRRPADAPVRCRPPAELRPVDRRPHRAQDAAQPHHRRRRPRGAGHDVQRRVGRRRHREERAHLGLAGRW